MQDTHQHNNGTDVQNWVAQIWQSVRKASLSSMTLKLQAPRCVSQPNQQNEGLSSIFPGQINLTKRENI